MGANTLSRMGREDMVFPTKEIANTVKTQRMKTKSLNNNSMDCVEHLINQIWDNRIEEFETQSLLYKTIEDIKFPHLRKVRNRQHNHYFANNYLPSPYDRKPYYMPNNYQPIVRWLMHNRILTRHTNANVIVYKVNRERILEIPTWKNTYNI